MFQTFFDPKQTPIKSADEKRLGTYRSLVRKVIADSDTSRHEYSLSYTTPALVDELSVRLAPMQKRLKRVVVVGIGGSSLGLEALHAALPATNGPELTVLDMITPAALAAVESDIAKCARREQIVVCVISKSGATTETLANASVLMRILADKFGEEAYQQVIYIGDPGTPLQAVAKKTGGQYIAMPKIIGGRYSVATEVGLVPLILLGHPVAEFVSGFNSVQTVEVEGEVAKSALRIYGQLTAGMRHYNFFAFEARLFKLGA